MLLSKGHRCRSKPLTGLIPFETVDHILDLLCILCSDYQIRHWFLPALHLWKHRETTNPKPLTISLAMLSYGHSLATVLILTFNSRPKSRDNTRHETPFFLLFLGQDLDVKFWVLVRFTGCGFSPVRRRSFVQSWILSPLLRTVLSRMFPWKNSTPSLKEKDGSCCSSLLVAFCSICEPFVGSAILFT